MKLFSENIFIDFHIVFTSNTCYNISVKKIERMINMSSKKHRKKLKQQYNKNTYNFKPKFNNSDKIQHNRDAIYKYLKERPNTYVTSDELVENCNFNNVNKTEIHYLINHVRRFYNIVINSKRGRNGGYMYYEQ